MNIQNLPEENTLQNKQNKKLTSTEVIKAIVDKKLSSLSFTAEDFYQHSMQDILCFACRFGSFDDVRFLVERGFTFYDIGTFHFYKRLPEAYVCLLQASRNLSFLFLSGLNDLILSSVLSGTVMMNSATIRKDIVIYLLKNKERVDFDPSTLLLEAILFGDMDIYKILKSHEICLSSDDLAVFSRILSNDQFVLYLSNLLTEDFYALFDLIVKEFPKDKKHFSLCCSKKLVEYNQKIFGTPRGFRLLVSYFRLAGVSRLTVLKKIIDLGRFDLLEIAGDCKLLNHRRDRLAVLEYAQNANNIEAVAWLLDFTNSHIDLAAEQRAIDRAAFRCMPTNPNSVTVLRKTWGFKYLNDNEVVLTSYKGNDIDVVVPESLGKRSVTNIGPCFLCSGRGYRSQYGPVRNIVSIKLPSTLKYISSFAFGGCESLTSVILPDSLETIDSEAFYGCDNIAVLSIPGSVKNMHNPGCMFFCKDFILDEGIETLEVCGWRSFKPKDYNMNIYLPKTFKSFHWSSDVDLKDFVSNPCTFWVYEGSEAEHLCKDLNLSYNYR